MKQFHAPETRHHVLVAFDSSLGSSVAVCRRGEVFEVVNTDPRGHAEAIGVMLSQALTTAGIDPRDVTGVVYGVGPGPFTGLRVGIAAAQAFALGAKVPLLPLHSHEGVALSALEDGAAVPVRVVQDAKRRELFVSDYAALDGAGIPRRIDGPRIEAREGYRAAPQEIWPEAVPAGQLLKLAARRLAAGVAFEEPAALYLRKPDVKQPASTKRVSS